MGLASPCKSLKRHDVRALLSYLLYFGIGGPARSAAVKKLRRHLNGRCSNSRADPALNFKVDQDVSPCVATIFEVEEFHKPVEFEQKGIDFVAKRSKHTNCSASTANADLVPAMYVLLHDLRRQPRVRSRASQAVQEWCGLCGFPMRTKSLR
jgi:hypothetical protein